ncbi:DUF4244 domain-containing protein [Arthrobacter sp. MMS18-M83]|uniref:DUF4244 domain-containing protein n=1 Tax=Arthrobacter sp. MMS18-M83 TaxID=2996261 RepID=UPI00227BD4BF|nr:DUF4244 domain-containing protein [Arthrobacter sp. MMS18-M83]WAH95786.1 DUF4244 domain-containing protein [Arthrobacter sp. MMS18-M83]
MNATADTLIQAVPSQPEAEVLGLFPGSQRNQPVRPPVRPRSSGETSPARSDAELPAIRQSKRRLMGSELGMATAEYAIATLAAVGFAGLLVVILRSEEVRGFLLNLIRSALALP